MSGTINADSRSVKRITPAETPAEALKDAKGPVKILVSEPHQKMNVEKYAKDHGKKATSTEKDGCFEVVIE